MATQTSQSRFKVIVITWAIIVFLSGLLFAIASPGGASSWLGFFFLLVAITITAAAFVLYILTPAKLDSTLLSTGLIASTLTYLVISGIISFIYIIFSPESLRFLVVPQLILLVLLAAVLLIFYVSSKGHKSLDIERRVSLVSGIDLRTRNIYIKLKGSYPEAAKVLEKVIEEIKYFDKNSEVRTDKTITDKLLNLEALIEPPTQNETLPQGSDTASLDTSNQNLPQPASQDSIIAAINEIYNLTLLRKEESLQAKTGSF
jgi:hypothetical protein